MKDFEQALRISETVPDGSVPEDEWYAVLYVRACAHEGLGNFDQARATIDGAVASFPSCGTEAARVGLLRTQT